MNLADERTAKFAVGGLSLLVCGLVIGLMVVPLPSGSADVSWLPRLNASLNGLAATFLIAGFLAVRSGRIELHRKLMIGAFVSSACFLVSYVAYHALSPGPAHYQGAYRGVYFTVLISHILLAPVVLPMALMTLLRGWYRRVPLHRAIARITLPLWLYVSVTGVVIFWMVYG